MANMPLVQPVINEKIYNIYLNKILSEFSNEECWYKILEEIENS